MKSKQFEFKINAETKPARIDVAHFAIAVRFEEKELSAAVACSRKALRGEVQN